jgi:transcriptional regulator with PAS, ATPase and Fis domain
MVMPRTPISLQLVNIFPRVFVVFIPAGRLFGEHVLPDFVKGGDNLLLLFGQLKIHLFSAPHVEFKRQFIHQTLRRCGSNKTMAASESGVSTNALWRALRGESYR